MLRFACTSPNRLSIPRSSITGGDPLSAMTCSDIRRSKRRLCRRNRIGGGRSPPPSSLCHVVRDLDLAGHDVGARLLQPLLHVGGDEAPVVLIDRVTHAALGHAERSNARFPRALLRGLERVVDGEIDALD